MGDLTTEAGSAATVAAVVETMGCVDILVNNAGAPAGGTGVTSNGVMPGLTYTPPIDRFFTDVAEQQGWPGDLDRARDYVLSTMVMQTVSRLGQPADIAGLVCLIASPRSDFMTGSTIRMDGGATPTVWWSKSDI